MINKVIHFSDLHAGHPEIKKGDIDALLVILSAEVNDNTLIVFSGDLFHKRSTVESEANMHVMRILNFINQLGVPAIFLHGTRSHDFDYMKAYSTNEFGNTELFPLISFVHTKTVLMIDGLEILCYPEEYIEEELEEYYPEIVGDKKYDMTIYHGSISDISYRNLHIESVPFKKAPSFTKKQLWNTSNIVLCGHEHQNQEYTNPEGQYLSYVGSWGKMEHSDNKKHTIGYLHVYDIEMNEETKEVSVINVEAIPNSATSKFKTIHAVCLNDNVIMMNDDGVETKHDLDDLEQIREMNELITTHTLWGVKIRLKVLNETNMAVNGILKSLWNANPDSKVYFVKDVIRDNHVKLQEEILADINELRTIVKIEDQVQHFIRERLGEDISVEDIKEALDLE